MNWCSPSAAAAFTPRDINIHFLGFNEAGNRQGGCPRRSGFNINGDSVKQANTGGGSWLPPNPGLHINEIMLQFSQLQPLPDRCLYSRTTFHHRLDPPKPSHHSFTCIHTRRTLSLRLFNQIHTYHIPPPTTPYTTPTTTNKFCQEVNVKIARYLPDSSAIHPYLNRSCQPMEAVGDGVEPIPGQTLLSKRQYGCRGQSRS